MRLKDITKTIEGDFYITLPHRGAIKSNGQPKTYNAKAVETGLDSLPKDWLEHRVVIHSWDWLTLLVEVKEDE